MNAAIRPTARAFFAESTGTLDRRALELVTFLTLLTVLNWPLIQGGSAESLAYSAARVAAGEWWRLLTFSFVHVSPYHLFLDGAAFLLLYWSLPLASGARRIGAVIASAAGSLGLAAALSPLIATHGLCGLSGVAHGLMAISALQNLSDANAPRLSRQLAAAAFVLLLAKCAFEAITGISPLVGLHFGPVGVPIVACHAGGVLGALAWFLATSTFPHDDPHCRQ